MRELARRGRYREDLASLLSTMVIELPPLASRREDLPLLAQLFLEEVNARGGKQLAASRPRRWIAWTATRGRAMSTSWANGHAVPRAGCGPLVRPEDLPERLRWAAEPGHPARRKDETIVLDEFLGRIERELIRRAGPPKGNKAKAARLLGLTRPRLYRRMVQLGLEAMGGADMSTGPAASATPNVLLPAGAAGGRRSSASARPLGRRLAAQLAEAGVRVWETRSLAECWEALADTPASFVVVEFSEAHAEAFPARHGAAGAAVSAGPSRGGGRASLSGLPMVAARGGGGAFHHIAASSRPLGRTGMSSSGQCPHTLAEHQRPHLGGFALGRKRRRVGPSAEISSQPTVDLPRGSRL